MRHPSHALSLILVLTLALLSTAWGAEAKVGYVDVQQLMEKAPQAERARQTLQQEFKPREEELASEQKAITRLEDKLRRDAEIMSGAKRSDLEREIRDRKREFKRAREALKEDFNLRRNEELNKLQKEIYEVVVDVAKRNGYDVVVTDSSVVYASDRIDMSSQVLRRLKAVYKQ